MLQISLSIALLLVSIAIFICFLRVVIGPTMPDRILGLDLCGINLVAMSGLSMILQDTMAYAGIALIIGIISFIGSVALAKFLERGLVIDRDPH